jgi:hypothetical protein
MEQQHPVTMETIVIRDTAFISNDFVLRIIPPCLARDPMRSASCVAICPSVSGVCLRICLRQVLLTGYGGQPMRVV